MGRAARPTLLLLSVLSVLPILSSCRTPEPPPPAVRAEPAAGAVDESWRDFALAEDRDRLDRLELAWEAALREARALGLASRVRAEGPLLQPQAGLPRATPPPGPYRCRLLRFGGRRAFTVYPSYFCDVVVEAELLSLTKQDGSERPGGYLWPDRDGRLIFLGAVALGAEPVPPAYGEDRDRDLIGLVERVGPFHYRLVMPWPPSGASLDILELIPFVLHEEAF
jgi:Domain of unknown function (DUF4893)